MDKCTRSIQICLHNTYTPNTRKYSLHCYIVPQDIPSLPILFRVCIKYQLAPLDLFVRFLSSLGLSIQFWASSTPRLSEQNKGALYNKMKMLGLQKNVGKPKTKLVEGKTTMGEQFFFTMFLGTIGAKSTSPNPQILNLYFLSTLQHKTGFPAMENEGNCKQMR